MRLVGEAVSSWFQWIPSKDAGGDVGLVEQYNPSMRTTEADVVISGARFGP